MRIEERYSDGSRCLVMGMMMVHSGQNDMLMGVLIGVDRLIIHYLILETHFREQNVPGEREIKKMKGRLHFLLEIHRSKTLK